MTVHILIDTCVWLDLAKDHRFAPVITAIEDLVSARAISLIVPRIVVDEFARNKDRVVEDSKRSLTSHFTRVSEAVIQFALDDEQRNATMAQLHEIKLRIAMKGEAANKAVDQIEKLLSVDIVEPTDRAKLRAMERALAKVAPFHLAKNSMGDALLIETYDEFRIANTDPEDTFVFTTTNIRDFSQPQGDNRIPHPDLLSVFPNETSRYITNIAELVREIDPEMLEEYEWEHNYSSEPRRMAELLDATDLLTKQVWYNRHMGRRIQIEQGEITLITHAEFKKLKGYHPEFIVDKTWKGAMRSAKRVERELGPENLGPWDDFEWGMINGKLSALRWVLGEDWDELYT